MTYGKQTPEFPDQIKKVNDWLNEVDFSWLTSGKYIPSLFALKFMNFIKLVNGDAGETNSTPPMHLAMIDKLILGDKRIVNLCARGLAKTSIFMEYLTLYLAAFAELPNFGKVSGMLYVSDSMDKGVKSARESMEFRYYNSSWLQKQIPEAKFTESYIEFCNHEGHKLGMRLSGAKTGVRGVKIFNKRPVMVIMDDLINDEIARSPVSMEAVKRVIHSDIQYALDPVRYKMIINGTPFNSQDIMHEIVESGIWAY